MRAELIEDGGAAAAEAEQFFRSPAFLEAEGATHTLRVEDLRLPLLVREIAGGAGRDAISPYGYPGGSGGAAKAPGPGEIDWAGTGLVSIFVRDRIGPRRCFAGGSERAMVHIADGHEGVRKRLREQIRRNERRGWSVAAIRGPEAHNDERVAFERAYGETMARTAAADRYLYRGEYFETLLRSERSWLVLASREGEAPQAGVIAVASDGHLHYYLGGTAEEALSDSPMKNLFWSMIGLGQELGLPVNLGAGLAPGDSLDDFKRGFATSQEPFVTHEIVCDRDTYDELSGEGSTGDFFPAYRA